eukprot:TRINITY_DN4918_c0_g1_i1.p1 TRINITY_DN4918_c0_g1~~TRINITY_DN4918_c0_g1_i1.p1  ORF type:complete len:782 (-),score=272.51 TRINITY_DN4918_c0_g1_i1:8-2353(-)
MKDTRRKMVEKDYVVKTEEEEKEDKIEDDKSVTEEKVISAVSDKMEEDVTCGTSESQDIPKSIDQEKEKKEAEAESKNDIDSKLKKQKKKEEKKQKTISDTQTEQKKEVKKDEDVDEADDDSQVNIEESEASEDDDTITIEESENSQQDYENQIQSPFKERDVAKWSSARFDAWNGRRATPAGYYYRFVDPWTTQKDGKFTSDEKELFLKRIEEFEQNGWGVGKHWGLFAQGLPGRVGYQCANYYRKLVSEGIRLDERYEKKDGGKGLRCKDRGGREGGDVTLSAEWKQKKGKQIEKLIDGWVKKYQKSGEGEEGEGNTKRRKKTKKDKAIEEEDEEEKKSTTKTKKGRKKKTEEVEVVGSEMEEDENKDEKPQENEGENEGENEEGSGNEGDKERLVFKLEGPFMDNKPKKKWQDEEDPIQSYSHDETEASNTGNTRISKRRSKLDIQSSTLESWCKTPNSAAGSKKRKRNEEAETGAKAGKGKNKKVKTTATLSLVNVKQSKQLTLSSFVANSKVVMNESFSDYEQESEPGLEVYRIPKTIPHCWGAGEIQPYSSQKDNNHEETLLTMTVDQFGKHDFKGQVYEAVLMDPSWLLCPKINRYSHSDSDRHVSPEELGPLWKNTMKKIFPKKGFLFIWVDNEVLSDTITMITSGQWGEFEYVENLCWYRKTLKNKVLKEDFTFFAKSHLTLLIFRKKGGKGDHGEIRHQRSADVVQTVGEGGWRPKPKAVYDMIETMLPGGWDGKKKKWRMLDLWADGKQQNRRSGWTNVRFAKEEEKAID